MRWRYRNWLHWEIRIWRLHVARWCIGAPCYLKGVNDPRHPLEVYTVRRVNRPAHGMRWFG